MSIHVKCFAMKRGTQGEYVDVNWHPRSGHFSSMDEAVASCRDGHHAEHAHEVKQRREPPSPKRRGVDAHRHPTRTRRRRPLGGG